MSNITKNKYFMSSIFENTGKFQLDESLGSAEKDPRVDGENIIGSVEGVFFVPDGFSRNNRFYPCELWNRQLSNEDINRRLKSSIMFGCIGHSQGPVTEQDLSEGKVSHIMDKLWIDESTGMGMGKAYILNTPAGKNLRTYLKAGSNLKVSSRGEGSFAEGMEKDGHPVVEADSYNLITFDFVIEPGFIETNPQLMENYIEEVLIDTKETVESVGKDTESMDMDKILEEYRADRDSAKSALEECQTKHAEQVKSLEDKVSSLQEQLDKSAKFAKTRASVSKSKLEKLQSVVESYKELGTVESIKKASIISKSAIQELKSYKALGSVKEIKEALSSLITISEELKSYKDLGNAESLKKLLAMSERLVAAQKQNKLVESAREISKETGVAIEEVAKMIKKQGIEATKQSISESVKEDEKVDTIVETKPLEEKQEKQPTNKEQSLLENLFAESTRRMFIEDDEEDNDEEPVEDSEEEIEDEDEDSTEEKETEDEESEEDEEQSDEERLDSVEDKVDSIQAQVDALTASFDKLAGEESEDGFEEEDYDFEIE